MSTIKHPEPKVPRRTYVTRKCPRSAWIANVNKNHPWFGNNNGKKTIVGYDFQAENGFPDVDCDIGTNECTRWAAGEGGWGHSTRKTDVPSQTSVGSNRRSQFAYIRRFPGVKRAFFRLFSNFFFLTVERFFTEYFRHGSTGREKKKKCF